MGLGLRLIIYFLNLVNAKKTIVVSYFVVDLLAKLSHPSLPRADCSLWKHGAEHCRTVCLARGSARVPCTTAWLGGMLEKACFFRSQFWVFFGTPMGSTC